MLLDADVQAGIVVDRTGRSLGLVTADTIAELMRETADAVSGARGGARAAGQRRSTELDDRPSRRPRSPGMTAGGTPMIDWAWIVDHLDDLAYRTRPAPLPRGDRGRRRVRDLVRPRRLVGPAPARSTARSRRSRASSTRSRAWPCSPRSSRSPASSIVTAEVPLVLYTLLIFVRNIVAGLRQRPARRPRGGRRDGLHARAGASGGSSCRSRSRSIVAGLRLATVSTIGLVTITGDPRRPLRRARLLHLRGLPAQLPDRDPLRCGAVDRAGDRRRLRARPAPASADARGPGRTAADDATIRRRPEARRWS